MQVPKACITIGRKGEKLQNGRGTRNNEDPGEGGEGPITEFYSMKGWCVKNWRVRRLYPGDV